MPHVTLSPTLGSARNELSNSDAQCNEMIYRYSQQRGIGLPHCVIIQQPVEIQPTIHRVRQ